MSLWSKLNYFYKGKHRGEFKIPQHNSEDQAFIDLLAKLLEEKNTKPETVKVSAIVDDSYQIDYYLTIVIHGTNPEDSEAEEVWAQLLNREFKRIDGFTTPVISTKHKDGFFDNPPEDWHVNEDTYDTVPIVISAEELTRALSELGYARKESDCM